MKLEEVSMLDIAYGKRRVRRSDFYWVSSLSKTTGCISTLQINVRATAGRPYEASCSRVGAPPRSARNLRHAICG
jgi:hypothetical protein